MLCFGWAAQVTAGTLLGNLLPEQAGLSLLVPLCLVTAVPGDPLDHGRRLCRVRRGGRYGRSRASRRIGVAGGHARRRGRGDDRPPGRPQRAR
ncbi:hypothetical protein [Dactylosporangium sucinum]|uniref:Uncharacterized protein n=1 Tax=Dactylosporangium sucinum TaxID=1424081 RepID=A0A917T8Y5_9ACTN|nr:hypothetical protein [Dactylosporangium sucinum]GGM12096.1 hypothetical protein GCM10007977_011580 [Dactylosporangium sucinum]